jgi:hypothetical protein
VTLSCSGAPGNSTCTFGDLENGLCPSATTAGVTLNGQNAYTANICIATGVAPSTASARNPADAHNPVAPMLAMLLPLALAGTRRRRWAGLLMIFAAILLAPIGCGVAASGGGGGGGGSGQNTTPSGTYTITVQGVSSTIKHSASVTLTVE